MIGETKMGVSGNGNHYESVGETSSTDQGSNKAHIYSGLDIPATMKNSRDGRLIQIVLIVVGGIVLINLSLAVVSIVQHHLQGTLFLFLMQLIL